MNRSFFAPAGRSPRFRSSSIWCIVGTAEYHVAARASAAAQNVMGSNPPAGTTTVPPLANVAMIDAIRPWMWKRGMTHRATSSGVRPYVAAMLPAE